MVPQARPDVLMKPRTVFKELTWEFEGGEIGAGAAVTQPGQRHLILFPRQSAAGSSLPPAYSREDHYGHWPNVISGDWSWDADTF